MPQESQQGAGPEGTNLQPVHVLSPEGIIFDRVHELLPEPPFTAQANKAAAKRVYDFLWQQSMSGVPLEGGAAQEHAPAQQASITLYDQPLSP